MTKEIKIHRLEYGQILDKSILRFCKGTWIRFTCGPSLFGRKINLFINYPEDDSNFNRNQFKSYKLKSHSINDEHDSYIDIKFILPGSFHYYFLLEDQCSKTFSDDSQKIGSGFILIEPELYIGDNNILSFDSIHCQTVISKCLGSFDSWENKLKVSYKSGYNMIHFTPIQELGASNSAYSIKNQLKLNPAFKTSEKHDFDAVGKLVDHMNKTWGILSLTDIVLNHTANETHWIKDHPECTYNLSNSPHLRPAYLLDRLLYHATMDIINGKWLSYSLSDQITTEEHLQTLHWILKEHYLPLVNIHEFYLINIDKTIEDIRQSYSKSVNFKAKPDLIVIKDKEFRRKQCTIDVSNAITLMKEEKVMDDVDAFILQLKEGLEKLNQSINEEINAHLNEAINNVIKAVRYQRISSEGPKMQYLSENFPLVAPYFLQLFPNKTLKEEEDLMYDNKYNMYIMAHNGWVIGDDPLRNFADPESNVYLRRELIVWGDSVKLRYGEKPEDSPFLWNLMKEYVEQTAQIFHGIRLDNCHSTPLLVAEYLLDCARKVRKNLFVIAELFTSSEALDNIFVNRLGLNCLIRESMAAHDSHELGRIIHRFSGEPVGAFKKFKTLPIVPSIARAIIFDMTHDNESPMSKRTIYDFLPSSGLISMSCSATGSNRGYDELVPHHIHVVNENRTYSSWDDTNGISYKTGIIYAKKILNNLHSRLANEGFTEIFVDQVNFDVVVVTRHNPTNHKSVILVARTCFFSPKDPLETEYIRPLIVSGQIEKIIFEAKITGQFTEFKKDKLIINGCDSFRLKMKENLNVSESEMIRVDTCDGSNKINFVKFIPGSLIAFEVSLETKHLNALNNIREASLNLDIINEIKTFDLEDLNYLLFRTDQEERDENFNGGAYNIPNFLTFNYCGLAGLMYHWKKIRTINDLGHPICNNIRNGLWLFEYIINRLSRRSNTSILSSKLEVLLQFFNEIPHYLRPCYFDLIITRLYFFALEQCWKCMSDFVKMGNNFVQYLSLGTIALVGYNSSSPLPPLSSNLEFSPPTTQGPIKFPICPTIAAGFPHFASGYMRNWGRDTFISFRGLLLITGRYQDAQNILLGFGGALRHGLIPNLLDKGINARYNCRDAIWWWLQSIKDYCKMCPEGLKILTLPVKRLFPADDSPALTDDVPEQMLMDVIQESLQKHFKGIKFRERNAGPSIDSHMTDLGFEVSAGIDRETGFVYGGNEHNCGTWMDKMGSSNKAGNKGKPSTPRDGSAIELVGLLNSVVSWINELYEQGQWPFEGVNDGTEKWTWLEWTKKIQNNFERKFWVGENDTNKFVNRRFIYKDSYGATHEWQDYQFRPNFFITLAISPELCIQDHAKKALDLAKNVLLGPLGVRTLDPSDWNYRGDYDNSNDSNDFHIAQGFNYHQGPEWLWPLGFYIRSLCHFNRDNPYIKNEVYQLLSKHYKYLEMSDWFGLPELTNSNGKFCKDSCHIQAWSHSTLLEALYDIENL